MDFRRFWCHLAADERLELLLGDCDGDGDGGDGGDDDDDSCGDNNGDDRYGTTTPTSDLVFDVVGVNVDICNR